MRLYHGSILGDISHEDLRSLSDRLAEHIQYILCRRLREQSGDLSCRVRIWVSGFQRFAEPADLLCQSVGYTPLHKDSAGGHAHLARVDEGSGYDTFRSRVYISVVENLWKNFEGKLDKLKVNSI